MIRALLLAAAVTIGAGVLPAPALAGSSGANAPTHYAIEDIDIFAKYVEDELARRGARVALVARIGRDPDDLPAGLRYSHVAWWVYSEIRLADGRVTRGYAVHNLYQEADDAARSSIVQDFPADFFRPVERLEAGIVVPVPEVQQKLLRAIAAGVPAAVHVPSYSLVANPFEATYQNCTEHALDVLNAALYDTTDPVRLKRVARQHFHPSPIDVGPLSRALGPLVIPGLTLADHAGPIRTTTYESIAAYMRGNGLTLEQFTLARRAPRLTGT